MSSMKMFAAALALVLGSTGALRADLVVNGSFEQLTNGPGQLGYNTNAVGWSTTGYNFVFAPGTADTTGADGYYGNLKLWGPNDGSNNGLPATSPDGGNFVAADGAYEVEPITQTINGLTAGKQYTVSFDWAGAQQYGYTSPTTEQWVVGFGSETQSTAIVQNANHGFTGWMAESFTFTADGSSDLLSFLAVGTPNGVPPFSLLDGVHVNAAVPEPSSIVLMGLGMAGLVAARRRKKVAAAAA